ncbi:hypothetical protein D3C78_1681820 [compost metagenome]
MAWVRDWANSAVRASRRASRIEVSKAMASTARVVINTRLSRPLPLKPSREPQKLPSLNRAPAMPV